jgi:hypothetical protein
VKACEPSPLCTGNVARPSTARGGNGVSAGAGKESRSGLRRRQPGRDTMTDTMAIPLQKCRKAAPRLRLLAAPAAAFLWCFAACVDISPPWKKVKAVDGSDGPGSVGGAPSEARDGSFGADGVRDAGAGGAINLGGGGAGGALGGAGGAIDAPWTGAAGEIDAGPGGTGSRGFDGSSIDGPVVAAGGIDGAPDIPLGGGGGTAASGGIATAGGASGSGSTVRTGGTTGSGGTSTSGGAAGTGGTSAGGGATGTGGTSTSGGATGTGGTIGSGGTKGPDAGTSPDARSGVQPDVNAVLAGLVVYYTFESADGTKLPDMSGRGNDGTLSIDLFPDGGTPSDAGYELVASKAGLGQALRLHKAGRGYVRVPTAAFANITDITIALWVNVATSQSWQRLVDVGINANIPQNTNIGTKYMNLVPEGSDSTANNMLFRISRDGFDNEQKLTAPSVATGAWTHVTLVLASGGGGKLYIDGMEKDSQSSVTLRPADLGAIDYAFIGKAPFSVNPPFDGTVDEFRVYNRALSAAEVLALFDYTGW